MVFYSIRSLKRREKYISLAQFANFLEKCVFEWWNSQLTVQVIFVIQKLKSKRTFLKKYTNWAKLIYLSLILREWEEKNQIFRNQTFPWYGFKVPIIFFYLISFLFYLEGFISNDLLGLFLVVIWSYVHEFILTKVMN